MCSTRGLREALGHFLTTRHLLSLSYLRAEVAIIQRLLEVIKQWPQHVLKARLTARVLVLTTYTYRQPYSWTSSTVQGCNSFSSIVLGFKQVLTKNTCFSKAKAPKAKKRQFLKII